MNRQALDLRLLPSALAGWVAALVAVNITVSVSLRVGSGLLAGALILTAAALVLRRPQSSESAGERASFYRPRRLAAVMLHLALSAGVATGATLSAAQTQYTQAESGWSDAVESPVPLSVTFRVTRDALPVQQRSGDGYRSQAIVLSFGEEEQTVRARAVVFTDAELQAGHRYTSQVRLSSTSSAHRSTAIMRPFGEDKPILHEPDRWTHITETFNRLRAATVEQSSSAVGEAPALLPGVILGDRSAQSPELTEAMRVSGLTHMTVVSGTHCALVVGALLGMARMLRMPRWTTLPLLVTGLVLFVMLVQPAPSVIRAAVMGSIGALAVFTGRGRTSSALLCLCVILLLVYDPWFAVEPAFQLSVAATAGIVLVGARLKDLFAHRLPGIVAAPLALAVSAQLFVTPVLLPIAQGVTLYSVPANIVAGPLLPLVTVPGTLAAVMSTTLPWLSTPLLWTAGLPSAGIAAIGYATASLPQALAPWPEGGAGWALAAVYTVAAIALCRILIDSRRRPRAWERLLLGGAGGVLAAVVIPVGSLPALILGPSVPEQWRFALCDVGQGDMLVVRTGERAGIVVDAGEEPELAENCLHKLGVNHVEILMITHDHLDHYGGTPGVAAAANIGEIIFSGAAGWSVKEAVESQEGTVLEVPESRGELGQNLTHQGAYPVTWQVWAAADYHPNTNDNSLVTLGDLEKEVAGLLLARDALPSVVDVLKVSHHGASNGGTAVLEHTDPAVALIGVGEGNEYGHPSGAVVAALEDLGAATYRTDEHGTVAFVLVNESLKPVPLE
ncbi:ComEC/Rec2 family competence protein [Nesterenkonia natronophila]|uniref:ComEC/Rec2 family competence protein n=1 Tax=Nesterenkonia natronophila TaxID=2174932 RepID=A0A3A4F8E5_9MICC|nr:ComEC/Rec2 family competence protein [Nesterenkonia natronophila]RJN31154.1 ComEC/Rec2 family competence protein [Nesterenkonia natronophila]